MLAVDEKLVVAPSRWETRKASAFSRYFLAAAVVLGVTLPAFLFLRPVGYRAIGLVYLLAVVVLSLFVRRGPTLFAAALSAIFWDFFFLSPIANLRIAGTEDIFMFGTYFAVALVLGQLTSRVSTQEKATRLGEERATALYLLTRELAAAVDLDQLVQAAVRQMSKVFDAQIVILLPDLSGRLSFHPHAASTYEIGGPEQPVAEWAFEQAQPAGKLTSHEPQVEALFFPLVATGGPVGVMGLSFGQSLTAAMNKGNLLDAFAQQIALALDRHRLREESEKAKRLAESERLSKNLLNSMSHEIRTPLAVIKSGTSHLAEFKDPELSESQHAVISEIQEATERLNRLVGNVLDITRLESGHVRPKLAVCDVRDLVHMAVKETRPELARHKVIIELAPELPLVPMDYVLTQQALINLLTNAAIHTPPGTVVQVRARVANGHLVLMVADRGPGIKPQYLPHLFDKFYRAPTAPTGGTGLGLSLVKGFAEAQGGSATVENRSGGGTAFSIHIPLGETAAAVVEPN